MTRKTVEELYADARERIRELEARRVNQVALQTAFAKGWASCEQFLERAKSTAASAGEASSRCPICGTDSPHPHDIDEIFSWLRAQASRWIPDVEIVLMTKTTYDYKVRDLRKRIDFLEDSIHEVESGRIGEAMCAESARPAAPVYVPVLDDDGTPTGYHKNIATGEVVTLADEYDEQDDAQVTPEQIAADNAAAAAAPDMESKDAVAWIEPEQLREFAADRECRIKTTTNVTSTKRGNYTIGLYLFPSPTSDEYWKQLLGDVMAEIAQYHDISLTKVGTRPAWIKATEARTAALK